MSPQHFDNLDYLDQILQGGRGLENTPRCFTRTKKAITFQATGLLMFVSLYFSKIIIHLLKTIMDTLHLPFYNFFSEQ